MEKVTIIKGAVSVIDREDVDTDQILPKQFLKRMGRDNFGQYLFYNWAREPGWSLTANPILATGSNFGCGSSREHAVWALADYGFRAIIAPSFGDIFYFNCTKVGLLPVVLSTAQVEAVMAAGNAEIDLQERIVRWEGASANFDIAPRIQFNLLNGLDDVTATFRHMKDIDTYEESCTMHLPNTVEMEKVL